MTYRIRPMREGDLRQVNEIDREAFPTQVPQPNYRQELQNKLARYIVATDKAITVTAPATLHRTGITGLVSRIKQRVSGDPPGGTAGYIREEYIIGFAGIWVLADESHITNIAVRRDYQRQGIGELLLMSSINLSRELHAETVTLEVRASNTPAQSLYSKYGFAEVGVRRGYYLDNREDGIIMTTENITSGRYQAHLSHLKEALAERWGQPVENLGKVPNY